MIKSLTLSLLLISACLINSINAVEVKDLYLVKLPIAEQGKTALWKASLSGLKEVLVRKSGSTEILQSQEVREAYRRVTRFLQRFEYASQDGDSEYPYIISLYFEPRLIDNLIQESKMPLWGANRPLTIIWIAVEEDFERKIVLESAEAESIHTDIQESATRRGLPVILPLMDLEDELVVSISDIWGRFPTAIRQASSRYAADVSLFGRIYQQGDVWLGNFSYINQGNQGAFEVSGESKESVVAQMTDQLADQLCSKYCVVEEVGIKNELLIDISDISSFQQFKGAQNYLASLSSVSRVEVVSVEKLNVLFKLTLFGQVNSTVEGIGLSQKMLSIEPPSIVVPIETTVLEDQSSGEPSNNSLNSNTGNSVSNDDIEENPLESEQQSREVETILNSNSAGDGLNHQKNLDSATQIERVLLQRLYYRWIG